MPSGTKKERRLRMDGGGDGGIGGGIDAGMDGSGDEPVTCGRSARIQRPSGRRAHARAFQRPVAAVSRTKSAKSRGGRPRARNTPSVVEAFRPSSTSEN